MAGMIAIYVFGLMIFFKLIYPLTMKQVKYIYESETNHKILINMSIGMSISEISGVINLTTNAIHKRLQQMREKYNCSTTEQLVIMLTRKGYFEH
jgi:DNA-binding NarL/FixJ family response regulator